jgi:hypothetical protein
MLAILTENKLLITFTRSYALFKVSGPSHFLSPLQPLLAVPSGIESDCSRVRISESDSVGFPARSSNLPPLGATLDSLRVLSGSIGVTNDAW